MLLGKGQGEGRSGQKDSDAGLEPATQTSTLKRDIHGLSVSKSFIFVTSLHSNRIRYVRAVFQKALNTLQTRFVFILVLSP